MKSSVFSASRSAAARRFGGADGDHLGGEVPFGDGRGGVEPFVALQADQAAAKGGGEGLGDLGLAGAGLAFEKQRAAEFEGEEDHGRQRAGGDVALPGKQGFDGVDAVGEWRSRWSSGSAAEWRVRGAGGQGGIAGLGLQPVVGRTASGARAGVVVGPDEVVASQARRRAGRRRGTRRPSASSRWIRKVGIRAMPMPWIAAWVRVANWSNSMPGGRRPGAP